MAAPNFLTTQEVLVRWSSSFAPDFTRTAKKKEKKKLNCQDFFFIWLHWVSVVACVGSVIAAHRLRCPVACGILVPKPRIKPMSPTFKGRFLTTGPPGKLLSCQDFEVVFRGPQDHLGFSDSLGLTEWRKLVHSRLEFVTVKDGDWNQQGKKHKGQVEERPGISIHLSSLTGVLWTALNSPAMTCDNMYEVFPTTKLTQIWFSRFLLREEGSIT